MSKDAANPPPQSLPLRYFDLSFDNPAGPQWAHAAQQAPTGWTPYLAKTINPFQFQDQYPLMQLLPLFQNQQAPPPQYLAPPRPGVAQPPLFDLDGFNNTPYRDLSFRINDFLFDSPVAFQQTPHHQQAGRTPLRVMPGLWFKENMPPELQSAHLKRPLPLLDTPPRGPVRLEFTDYSTPLKTKLHAVTNAHTPPQHFPQLSPSTIIAASGQKDLLRAPLQASPTPAARPLHLHHPVLPVQPPAMGTFGPQQPVARRKQPRPPPTTSKFQIVFTDVESLMAPRGKKRKSKKAKAAAKAAAPLHEPKPPVGVVSGKPRHPPLAAADRLVAASHAANSSTLTDHDLTSILCGYSSTTMLFSETLPHARGFASDSLILAKSPDEE